MGTGGSTRSGRWRRPWRVGDRCRESLAAGRPPARAWGQAPELVPAPEPRFDEPRRMSVARVESGRLSSPPCARGPVRALNPARVRSRISSRSTSASAAKMPHTRRRAAVTRMRRILRSSSTTTCRGSGLGIVCKSQSGRACAEAASRPQAPRKRGRRRSDAP